MKSPLKSSPLNNPAESSEKFLEEFKSREALIIVIFPIIFVILAFLEWQRWYSNTTPNPLFYSIVALLAIAHSVYRHRRMLKIGLPLKLGVQGEKAVGQLLNSLRGIGAQVFHDIQGEGFNLDHVVIHKSGIYVIETKTFSKPGQGNPKIHYDGESLKIPGKFDNNSALIQVRAGAKWLQEILKESTSLTLPVKPVLLFPGWDIESSAQALKSDVWVLNPKALRAFIERREVQLESDQVSMAAFHISKYVQLKNLH